MKNTAVNLDVTSLREQLEGANPPRLLDVRTPGEFAGSRIPGSFNIPLDELRKHCDDLGREPGEIVIICRSGARAVHAEKTLTAAGLTRTRILTGGILAWEAEGAPVNRSERQRWDLERQVRLVAGSIVLAGILGGLAVPGLQWVSAFIGAGLVFSALTNTCGMGMLLAKLPYNRAPRPDAAQAACPAEEGRAS